ncbi:MAG: hypothetical protein ACUVSQ_01895 [Pseudanabaenaceae cyanobacterium]
MDILPNSRNDFLIGAWGGDGGDAPVGNAAALTALTLGAEHIVLSGEAYMGDRDFFPEGAVLANEDLSTAVAAGVQAAALEAAWVGNLLAVLADTDAGANPIGLS